MEQLDTVPGHAKAKRNGEVISEAVRRNSNDEAAKEYKIKYPCLFNDAVIN
jgi:hypothetical protein